MKSEKQGMTKRRSNQAMSFLNHARRVFFCPKAPYVLLKKTKGTLWASLRSLFLINKNNNTWTADHPSRLPMVQYYKLARQGQFNIDAR
jgi:hypothetical protein